MYKICDFTTISSWTLQELLLTEFLTKIKHMGTALSVLIILYAYHNRHNISLNLKYINKINLLKYVYTETVPPTLRQAWHPIPPSLPSIPIFWATNNSQPKFPCDSKSFLEQWGVGQPWLTLMTCSMTKGQYEYYIWNYTVTCYFFMKNEIKCTL